VADGGEFGGEEAEERGVAGAAIADVRLAGVAEGGSALRVAAGGSGGFGGAGIVREIAGISGSERIAGDDASVSERRVRMAGVSLPEPVWGVFGGRHGIGENVADDRAAGGNPGRNCG